MAATLQKSFSIKPNFGNTVVAPHSNYQQGLQRCVNRVLTGEFASNPINFYQEVLALALSYRGLGSISFGLLPEELAPHFRGQFTPSLNTVTLNSNLLANPARLAETIITISHETRHKYQKDTNHLHKIFGKSNDQFVPAALTGIGKLLGASNEKLDQALYPCAKSEFDAFTNQNQFARSFMQEALRQAAPPMQDFIQKQLDVVAAFERYENARIVNSVENLTRDQIPVFYQRADMRFNKYLDIAKACSIGKPLTLEQDNMLNSLKEFGLAPKEEHLYVHNLVGMAKLLSICPIRENVAGFVDYLRDTNDDGSAYKLGMTLIKDLNLPITKSDFTKLTLRSDMYHGVRGSQPRFEMPFNLLSGVEESVLVQNLLATQGKALTKDIFNYCHRLENEGRLNVPGQSYFNFAVIDRYIDSYSDNPIAIFNGQPVYGCSELLDSVFASYIQNNPTKSIEERNGIYNAMSDNLTNIIAHFPNFSPNNKEVINALNGFINSPFEKQFEDKLEYINQASSSLTPQMAQAMGRYADSQNPSVIENNAAYMAQNPQAFQTSSVSTSQNVQGEDDGQEIDTQELGQLLNSTVDLLAQSINMLCQVLTTLTEVLNSPQVQEVFARAGVESKDQSNLVEEVLGTTKEQKIEELKEDPFAEGEVIAENNGQANNADTDGYRTHIDDSSLGHGVDLKVVEQSVSGTAQSQPQISAPVSQEAVACAPEP